MNQGSIIVVCSNPCNQSMQTSQNKKSVAGTRVTYRGLGAFRALPRLADDAATCKRVIMYAGEREAIPVNGHFLSIYVPVTASWGVLKPRPICAEAHSSGGHAGRHARQHSQLPRMMLRVQRRSPHSANPVEARLCGEARKRHMRATPTWTAKSVLITEPRAGAGTMASW